MANISIHHSSQAPMAGVVASFTRIVATWHERARQRRELGRLDYRMMRDLGISPTDVQFEANKPFWRA